jgi:hypothetical protein
MSDGLVRTTIAAAVLALLLWAPAGTAAEQPYSVQMHLHGSLSEGNGTMWGHTLSAEASKVDIIWWSDHDNRIAYWKMEDGALFGWENGLDEPDALQGKSKAWVPSTTSLKSPIAEASTLRSYEGVRSLRFAGRGADSKQWKILAYHYDTQRGIHRRCLLSDIVIRVAIRPPSDLYTSKNKALGVQVDLSKDNRGRQMSLIYLAGIPQLPASTSRTAYRWLPQLTPGQWNVVEIPVTEDAVSSFPYGDDNTLWTVHLGILARRNAQMEVFFDAFEIVVDGPKGQALHDTQRSVVESRYSRKVVQHVGTEITPLGHHLNAFGSTVPLIDYDTFTGDHPQDTVDYVHSHGGIVSYNHIFGAGGERPPEDYRKLIDKAINKLVGHRGYGADILEVGYVHRGLPIEGHLEVWDAVTAAGIFMTGNAVSDHHNWDPWETKHNRMVTWIWAESPSEEDLMDGLLAGRVFFGDPYILDPDGEVDLTTPEGYRMGQTIVTSSPSHDLTIRMTGLPAGSQVRLIVDGSPARSWTAAGPTFLETVSLDTRSHTFARAEAWSATGAPVAFSNPIHFLRAAPPGGLPPERVPPALRLVGPVEPRLDEPTIFLPDLR